MTNGSAPISQLLPMAPKAPTEAGLGIAPLMPGF